MTGSEQAVVGPLADAASIQGNMLVAPEALQGKKLRLGKKVTNSRVVSLWTYVIYNQVCCCSMHGIPFTNV